MSQHPEKSQEWGKTAGEPPWPSPVYAWFVVFVLTVAYTISFIDRQIIALLAGPIQQDLGVGDTAMGLLGGFAFALFYTFLGIPIGRLADHRSRRGIIAVGLFFWSLMTMVCGLAKNFWHLFFARVGVGIGEATLSPAAYSMIADYFPKEQLGRALSVFFIGVYAGTGLAFLAGGAVIAIVGGMESLTVPVLGDLRPWQAAFMIVGAPGILYVLVFLAVKEPARRGLINSEHGDQEVPLGEVLRFIWERRATYVPHFLGYGCLSLIGYASTFWIVEFYVRTYGTARAEASYIYGMLLLGFAIGGVVFSGWLSDKLEARGMGDAKIRMGMLSALGQLPAGALFPLMPDQTSATIVLAIAVTFAAFPFGTAAASLQAITPNQMRGLVSAVYLFVINIIGLGLGPPFVGFLTDFVFADPADLRYSLSAKALIMAPLALLLLWLCLPGFRRAREEALLWGR